MGTIRASEVGGLGHCCRSAFYHWLRAVWEEVLTVMRIGLATGTKINNWSGCAETVRTKPKRRDPMPG